MAIGRDRDCGGRDRWCRRRQQPARARSSMEQAVRMAEQRYNARVVRAETRKDNGRTTVYVLRLLNDPGGCGPCTSMPPAARCSRGFAGHSCAYWSSRTKPALRELLKTRLDGCTASRSTWRATARRACSPGSEYPLDVAIIDLGLPKLPGLELIRRLRARRQELSDPGAHRARQLAGQGRGPAGRRRRLRRQAVPLRGGAGAGAGAAAARRRLGHAGAALRADRARYARADRAGERRSRWNSRPSSTASSST